MAEDFIIFNTEEFKFIDLPDSLCTGSSIMPQKKNPDVLELIRGKTGRVYAHLINLMVNLKGLPMTYNRDLQEDKEPIFDATNTILNSLKMMILIVKDLKFRQNIEAGNLLLATDLAKDYLVEKNIPFRESSSHSRKYRSLRHRTPKTLRISNQRRIKQLLKGF